MSKIAKAAKSDFSQYATGRRKTSTARVYLRPIKDGEGKITVNDEAFERYFTRETIRKIVKQPLEATNFLNKFDIVVTARGGGKSGQAGATRLGIARALVLFDENQSENKDDGSVVLTDESLDDDKSKLSVRKILRQAKLLTRDPRAVERKKVGRAKARRGKQFSKR